MIGLGIVNVGIAEPAPTGAPPSANVLLGAQLIAPGLAPLPHPPSQFFAGVQGPNVGAPSIATRLITTQELPYHPPSQLAAGFIESEPPINREVVDYLILQREAPYHPPSFFWSQFIDSVPQIRRWVITTQELPFHPGSIFRAGRQGPNVASEVFNRIITTQEQPFHPLWPRPPMQMNIVLSSGHIQIYIID